MRSVNIYRTHNKYQTNNYTMFICITIIQTGRQLHEHTTGLIMLFLATVLVIGSLLSLRGTALTWILLPTEGYLLPPG